MENKAAEAQIAADPQLGQTPEERLARLAGAKKLANTFNVAALCVGAWGYLYPKPYALVVLALVILPWVAVLIVARSDGLYRILARRNEVRPSLALPILMPGFVLRLLSLQIGVEDLPRALGYATVVTRQ